jgi:hypothetical protein
MGHLAHGTLLPQKWLASMSCFKFMERNLIVSENIELQDIIFLNTVSSLQGNPAQEQLSVTVQIMLGSPPT